MNFSGAAAGSGSGSGQAERDGAGRGGAGGAGGAGQHGSVSGAGAGGWQAITAFTKRANAHYWRPPELLVSDASKLLTCFAHGDQADCM